MESVNININLPSSWEELDDKMLRYVYALIAKDFSIDEVKVLALVKWGGCRVLGRSEGQAFLLSFGKEMAVVQCVQLAQVMTALDWLENIPSTPVRLEKIRRHRPVAGDFQGVPFEKLIIAENLYQGFLATRNDAMLDELAAVLYPGLSGKLAPEERVSVFYWVAALKNMLAMRFPDFYQPTPGDTQNLLGSERAIGTVLQEAMDAQIRALTKGDITKECEILAMDTWRALTELNAQAKEYKQMNEKINDKK